MYLGRVERTAFSWQLSAGPLEGSGNGLWGQSLQIAKEKERWARSNVNTGTGSGDDKWLYLGGALEGRVERRAGVPFAVTGSYARSKDHDREGGGVAVIDLSDGVPAISTENPTSFEEFWPFFVSQHLHPKTRAVHAWGASVYTGGVAALLLGARRRRAIAGASLIAGAAQLISHRIYERNKAIDTDRVARPRYHWPLLADYLMVGKMLNGTIEDEVIQVREALGLKPDQITLADAGITPSTWRPEPEPNI